MLTKVVPLFNKILIYCFYWCELREGHCATLGYMEQARRIYKLCTLCSSESDKRGAFCKSARAFLFPLAFINCGAGDWLLITNYSDDINRRNERKNRHPVLSKRTREVVKKLGVLFLRVLVSLFWCASFVYVDNILSIRILNLHEPKQYHSFFSGHFGKKNY